MEFDKVYFIIHPAYTIGEYGKENRKTPKQLNDFIKEEIMPFIRKAEKENALIIILPTKVNSAIKYAKREFQNTGKYTKGFSTARIRKLVATEEKLIKTIQQILGNRCIRVDGEYPLKSSRKVQEELKKRKFTIKKDAELVGLGSYRDLCVQIYSNQISTELKMKKRVNIPKKGTIPLKRSKRRP